MVRLGRADLDVFPICLGGNVFGWTADEQESRSVLDAYVRNGGNFVDTANSYVIEHGRSEEIIGRWIADRRNRDKIVIATKVGGGRPGSPYRNLRATTIEQEAEASLRRLQIDQIDLYYAHFDDLETPLEESLRAFDRLVQSGVVRYLGASNYSTERLEIALRMQRNLGLAQFTVLQPEYNLVERGYESTLRPVTQRWDLAVLPYYALANGFLTGKYRSTGEPVHSIRAKSASRYLERGGAAVLQVLDDLAATHATTVAAVAIAWLRAQEDVVAPIASARTVAQLGDIVAAAALFLTNDELEALSAVASAIGTIT